LIIDARTIDSRQCDRLLALFIDHDANTVDPFVEGNRSEYISSRQGLYDLQHRTGSFDPKFMKEQWQISGDTTSPLACVKLFTDLWGVSEQELPQAAAGLQAALLPGAWQGGKMLSDENYAKEVEAVNRFFATILALAEKTNDWRKQEAAVKEAEASIDETILAKFVVPPVGGVMESIRRNEAHLRGTQCLLALRRWQLKYANSPPPDLATVVKAAGIPDVPMDPYSDQPLRMALIDGKPVVYSVGPDGKDDKAKIRSNWYTREPGDFIFQREPSSQRTE
jgi:hypothetical protein